MTWCCVTGNVTNKKTLPVRLAASLVQIQTSPYKTEKIKVFHHCLNVNRVISISKFPNKFARLSFLWAAVTTKNTRMSYRSANTKMAIKAFHGRINYKAGGTAGIYLYLFRLERESFFNSR